MPVNLEEFQKLQKTVQNLMKIIGAFNSSMKSLKERIFELEDKVHNTKEESAEQETEKYETELNLLKELSNMNKQSIEIIDSKIKKLEEDQINVLEKCTENENNTVQIHFEVSENKEKLKECIQELSVNKQSSDSNNLMRIGSRNSCKCKNCDKEFSCVNYLKTHMNYHHPRIYKCKNC